MRLPRAVRAAVKRLEKARAEAESQAAKLRRTSADAARAITEKLSLRDAGELRGRTTPGSGRASRGCCLHVVLDQTRPVDRERLIRRVGKLSAFTCEKVLLVLQEMLAA